MAKPQNNKDYLAGFDAQYANPNTKDFLADFDAQYKAPTVNPEYTVGAGLGDTLKTAGAGLVSGTASSPLGIEQAARNIPRSILNPPTSLTPQGLVMLAANEIANTAASFVNKKPTKLVEDVANELTKSITGSKQSVSSPWETTIDRTIAAVPHIPGFQELSDWGQKASQDINASVSEQGQNRLTNTQLSGKLWNPTTWSMGKDPSTMGFILQGSQVLGSLAPLIATTLITKSPTAATAMGFGQSAGEGATTAQQFVDAMPDSKLAETSPYFKELIQSGVDPKEARNIVKDKAAGYAAQFQGVVGAFGGNFTGKLLTHKFDKILDKYVQNRLGKIVAASAVGMTEEGSEEFIEGLASDLGINKTVVKEFGTDSFANFLLGSMGGGVAGAYTGAVAKKNIAQTPPIPPVAVVPPDVNAEVPPAVPPAVPPTTPPVPPVSVAPTTSAVLNEADIEPPVPETPVATATAPVTAPTTAPVAIDAARIQELKNSIAEGEMIAKSGKKTDGTKMSKGELGAVKRSIESAKIKLNELEAVPMPQSIQPEPAAAVTPPLVAQEPLTTAEPTVVKIPNTTNAVEQKAAMDAMKALPAGGMIEMNGVKYRKTLSGGWDIASTVSTPEALTPTEVVTSTPVEAAAPVPLHTSVNNETKMESSVYPRDNGTFNVAQKDIESGETLPTFKNFKTKEEAIDYANTINLPKAPVEKPKTKAQINQERQQEKKISAIDANAIPLDAYYNGILNAMANSNKSEMPDVYGDNAPKAIEILKDNNLIAEDKDGKLSLLPAGQSLLTDIRNYNPKNTQEALSTQDALFAKHIKQLRKPVETVTAEQKAKEKKIAINKARQKAKSKSNTLLTKLIDLGGVSLKDKRDTSGEKRSFAAGYANAFTTNARTSLRGHIESGSLDEYLPYDMRLEANKMSDKAFDSMPAYNYLANFIRQGEPVTPYIEAEKEISKHEAEYGSETRLSNSEGDILDSLEEWANANGINVESLKESLVGDTTVQKERELLRMLQEEFDNEQGNAGVSETAEGPQGADIEVSGEKTSEQVGEKPLELTGQTEAEIKADEAKVKAAEESKAKEEAKAEQKAKAEKEPFNLTGSDREADVAGAKDLFATEAEKPKYYKYTTREQVHKDAEAIKNMDADVRDDTEIGDFPGSSDGYAMYEAKKMLPKPSDKLKRITSDNSFYLYQQYDYIANIDGEMYGVTKQEDPDEPDDESKFVFHYNRIDEPSGHDHQTWTDDPKELINEIKDTAASDLDAYINSVEKAPKVKAVEPTKIEDFGEKIFVKKDAFANFKNKVDESKEVDIETSPLSKSWVEPDYQKLLDEGMSPFGVAFLHSTRDAVPTKPKATWKLRGWVKKAQTLRDLSYGFIDGSITEEQIKEIINKEDEYSNYNYLKNRIDLYLAAGHEKSLKGYELSKHSWTYYKGMKYDPPGVILWDVTSANGTQISESEDREEAIAKFVTAINKPKAEIEKAEIKFGVWSRRDKDGFFIGKKIGKNIIYLKMLPTVKEARDYILNNHDELVAQFEKYKEIPSERGEINQVRVGADHRMGANVSQEQFFDTFGFRSTIFGNTVNNARRQQDLNNAYDALMDLAGVLEIPPKALSMNGEIGLLFGADGRGGKNPASAHYSNSKLAINLTKTNGAGSLAHELFHALDNYFSRMGGDKYKMLTETQKASANVRPEVVAAFKDLMTAISATSIKERSKNLDKRRTKEYWSTGLEMAARAFESYVINKLKDQNASNDYLANIVSEKEFNIEDGYPYPTAAEIPAIRAAFDNFFNVLETKETDKGVMLYNIESKVQTKTPAFKKWFGNSKIVDSKGNPLVVYHGTKREFNEFKSNYGNGLVFFTTNPVFAGSWPVGTGGFREGPAGTTEEYLRIRDVANNLSKTMMTPSSEYDISTSEGRALFKKEIEEVKKELERLTGFRDAYDFETKAGLQIMPVYLSIQNPFDATKDYAVVEDFLRKSEGGNLNKLIDKGYHKKGNWLIYEVDSVIKFLKEKGYDGIWLNENIEGKQETIAPFSPNQIKSATGNRGTFDKSSNILLNKAFNEENNLAKTPDEIRDERIQELRVASMQVGKAIKHIASYGSNLPLQRKLNKLLEREASIKEYLESTKPENNSADNFMARATKELAAGNISEAVEAVIRQVYEKYPGVLEGLKLSVKVNKNQSNEGSFNPYARIVALYKNTSGVEDTGTVRHEITHTLEQMMTPQAKQAVVTAWGNALEKAMKKHIDPASKAYFDALLNFLENPSKANFDKASNLMPSYDFYQYMNPSEYWAVNSEKLLEAKLGTPWNRFVLAVKRLIEGLKSVLGFDNTYAVHKVLNNLLKEVPQRQSKEMLIDYITKGKVKLDFLNNIEDDNRLMDSLGVSAVPSHIPVTLREKIGETHKSAEELVHEIKTGPNNVLKAAGSAIVDTVTQARIESVFSGAGLEKADAKKYAGKIRDANGNMLPSIAVKNAGHANSVFNAVLHQGKMRYDEKLGAFTAYDSDVSMKHVIEQQHALRIKVGVELADKIINTWFAAKRTKGIQDNYLNLMNEIRDLQEELLTEEDPEVIAQLTADLNAAQHWLDALESAFINVPSFLVQKNAKNPTKVVDGKTIPNILYDRDGMPILDDEAMHDIIALSKKYPELTEMMKNWKGVNHNMIDNMAFSSRISEKEAEGLKKIESYSPWQRVRDSEEESLFGGKSSSFTSGIARFKKTRTELPLENVVENMNNQVKRMINSSLTSYAYNRIAMEYATRKDQVIDTKTGLPKVDKKTGLPIQGKIKVFSKEGRDSDGVRFPIHVNGRRVIIQIADSQIADAMLGLAMGPVNVPFQAAMSGFSNLVRRSITFSGYFQTKQVFYDAPTAAWVSGVKRPDKVWAKSFSTYLRALWSIKTGVDSPTIKLLKAAGVGGYHTFHRESLAEEQTTIEAISGKGFARFKRMVDKIGDASDYAQRGAIYDQVLAETGDHALALLKASDIVDWSKHGLHTAAQGVRQTVPFLGAYAIQLDALAQASVAGGTISSAKAGKGVTKNQALAQFYLKTGLSMAAITAVYALAAGSDDDYWKLDDDTRARNFYLPFSKKAFGHPVLIPMHSTAALFWKVIPESALTYIVSQGTKNEIDATRARAALWRAVKDSMLGPMPIPAAIKAPIEIAFNHDSYTGTNVVPQSLAKLDAAEQYNYNTSELAKFLSAATTIPFTGNKDKAGNRQGEKRVLNPIETSHLIRGWLGSVGTIGEWVSNQMFSEHRPTSEARDNPLTGGIIGPETSRRNETLFYDLKERAEPAYNTYIKMVKENKTAESSNFYDANRELIEAYGYTSKADTKLQEINTYIKFVGKIEDKSWTKDKKLAEILRMQALKSEVLDGTMYFRKRAGL